MGPLSSIGRTNPEVDFPYMTCVKEERYIANVKDGNRIGYKYLNLDETKTLGVSYRMKGQGRLKILTEKGASDFTLPLSETKEWKEASVKVQFEGDRELYLVFEGEGVLELITLLLG